MMKPASILLVFLLTSIFDFRPTEAAAAQFAEKPPIPDLSTPESALRSYWALLDWRQLKMTPPRQSEAQQIYIDAMTRLTVGQTRQFFQTLDMHRQAELQTRFHRTITSNTQETPSRAVILANVKNVTPIPSGAKPSAYEVQSREKGADFKYLITLDAGHWKILEVWWVRDFGTTRLHEVSLPIYPSYVPPQ